MAVKNLERVSRSTTRGAKVTSRWLLTVFVWFVVSTKRQYACHGK